MTPDLISRAGGHHHKRRREPCSWRSRPHALAAALSDSEMLGPGRSTLWSSSNQPSAPLASSVSVGAEQLFESVDVV